MLVRLETAAFHAAALNVEPMRSLRLRDVRVSFAMNPHGVPADRSSPVGWPLSPARRKQDRLPMTNKNPNSGPEPEEADPLSATAMFLKAFESDSQSAKKAADPFAPAPPSPAGNVPNRPAPPGPAGGQGAARPGEFTEMFNSLGTRPAPPATPPREAPPQASTQVVRGSQQPPPDPGAGDFTRIFVSSVTPSFTPPSRPSEETPRPAPPSAGPSKAKGFSSPGASDSAEGGFTQFFSNPPRASAPVPPSPPPAAPAPQPAESSWRNDPFFRPPEKPAEGPSPSVTSILSSLAGPGAGSSAPRTPEPAPYRPEPMPSYAPPKPAEEPGGVTRLIQRLSHEPMEPMEPQPAA